jgi:hypothetical protein
MNMIQGDCPDGLARDVWFRITPNITSAQCQSRVAYVTLGAVLIVVLTSLAALCLLGIVLSSKPQRWAVGPYFGLCAVFLILGDMNLWLGLTQSDFYSGDQGSAPISLFYSNILAFNVAVLAQYKRLARFSGSLMGNQTYQSEVLQRGMQSVLGRNSRLDHALFYVCVLCVPATFIVLCILLPLFPMPKDGYWTATGNLYAKDFLVSLGMWMIMFFNVFVSAIAILSQVRIRQYLVNHIKSELGNSKIGAPREWHNEIHALIVKFNYSTNTAIAALVMALALELCMSLDSILGLTWWSVYLVYFTQILVPCFILSTSFPILRLKAILGYSVKAGDSGATGEPRMNISSGSSPQVKGVKKTLAVAVASELSS